jgi:putative chitinase
VISAEKLQRVTGCPPGAAQRFSPDLSNACARYGINTLARLAAFLAQLGHESGSLVYVRELWGPSFAQARYEGRADLGNTQPGDGERFKGRGLLQITGRENYRAMRDLLRAQLGTTVPDFEADPQALETPEWACWSAAAFWGSRRLNELADAGDFDGITRRINGGQNGAEDRRARWRRAKQALAAAEQTAPVPTESGLAMTSQPYQPTATAPPAATIQEKEMPLPLFIAAALPALIDAIPKLGKLFGSGSDVAERNVKAAELAVTIAQDALGATNAQDAVERLRADPAAVQVAQRAIEERWYELAEAGGGGIDGARKADAAAVASGEPVWRSPSFWAGLALLPLAYVVVIGVVFNVGGGWSADVRAAVATTVISLVIGGIAAYYFGSTTRNNRGTPPQP